MILRTWDTELIKSIVTREDIYAMSSDDSSPISELYQPPNPNDVLFLLAIVNDDIAGLFILVPQNGSTLEVHTCIKQEYRGRHALKAAKEMLRVVFANTKAEKITTSVPFYNPQSRTFAKLSGMIDEGVNRLSIKKDGVLYNQWSMGITKEEVCQQPQ